MNTLAKHPLLSGTCAIFVSTLVVYLMTLPRVITLEDAGLFQMICQKGGIGHPPGYPLFVLSCQAFTSLPFWPPGVFAGNLLSGIYAAAACSLLVLVTFELTRQLLPALVAGLAYGFSATFWSQAIIIEVYTLAACLFALSFWLALRFVATYQHRYLFLLSLVSGLSLANHWPLHLLSSLGILTILLADWRPLLDFLKRPLNVFVCLGLGLLGLTPYLSLFQVMPAFAVYGEIESWEQFFRYIARAAYNDQYEVAGWLDRWQFQTWVLAQTAREFHLLLLPFILIGVGLSLRQLSPGACLSLLFVYFGGTTLLILLLGFEYNYYRQAVFEPYPIVAYMAGAVWLALGVSWSATQLSRVVDSPLAGPGLAIAVLALLFFGNLAENNRRDDGIAYLWAQTVWDSVPPDADFFVVGDTGVGLLGYLHHVEGQRQDLNLFSWHSLVFSNRLAPAGAPRDEVDERRRSYIEQTDRPVFSTVRPPYPYIDRGLVFERSDASGFSCEGRHESLEILLDVYLNDAENLDGHERQLLFVTLLDATKQHLGMIMFSENPERALPMLQNLQQSLPGKLGTLGMMLRYRASADVKPFLTEMVAAAKTQLTPEAPAQISAMLEEYGGRVAMLEPAAPETALAHFRRSIDYYSVPVNPSRCRMIPILHRLGLNDEAAVLETAFGACPKNN